MDYARGQKRKLVNEDTTSPQRRAECSQDRTNTDSRRAHTGGGRGWSSTEQSRINKIQEDERHREFLAKEGQFVLQQKRKAAEIRVKEGRAQPIDWLAVNLRIIDPVEDLLNEDVQDEELDYVDPEHVIEDLNPTQLTDMRRGIEEFLALDRNRHNREYWRTMEIICKERQKSVETRTVRSISSDVDKMFRPKSFEELEKLEKQINGKLDSDEPIDTDYWQQLLDSLLVYKAKARLKQHHQSILDKTPKALRSKTASLAQKATDQLTRHSVLSGRQEVLKHGYIPTLTRAGNVASSDEHIEQHADRDDDNKNCRSMVDRTMAQGVDEDEEVFAGEEQVETKNAHLWKGKYRPRKPRYFNRMQMGYEWNKYNQTHYDHDNPPPKVVQGYKFHIFYPDLIDPTRAPTYKITREGGRKKGETLAPAGEEDTCIIRFMSGPPYEDVAFRIVDRDWDYSAKHDRGFVSTFENGILTLHFSFRKIHYRK